ncbi:MAG: metallophosphoesterase [Sphingobium sp.]
MIASAAATPIVRRLTVDLPFPADAPRRPVTIALLTDTHMSGPDNGPQRMARIVAQINALKPDLILLGGDYMGDAKGGATYHPYASIAPFAGLRAPLGVMAVLGNHDNHSRQNPRALPAPQWRAAFASIGIPLLIDEAARRGPLVIGGMRDIYTGRPKADKMLREMARLGGAPVVLSHGPDGLRLLPDSDMLILVGHTHCGQISFPIVGPLVIPSDYGPRFACGDYKVGKRAMVVSAGVGTSRLPFRLLAPPDIWLVTVRPR